MTCDCQEPSKKLSSPQGPTFSPVPDFNVCQIGVIPADRLVPHTTYIRLAPSSYRMSGATPSATESAAVDEKLDHLGYMFLEQTRLRPAGTVIGEHVYTLSLAPQETVILTQKSWTKRKQSIEELSAYEIEHSFERSSALSNELAENLEHQIENSSKFSLNASVSGSYGFAGFGVQASLGTSYDTASSEKDSRANAVKQSQQRTEKATSKARSEHKTTFKLESETGSESGSRRTVRNLNTCHSLMLNYYKILQRFHIIEERIDVRLCWAPCVKTPGQEVFNRLKADLQKAANALAETEDPDWAPKGYPQKPDIRFIDTEQIKIKTVPPMGAPPGALGYDTTGVKLIIPQDYEFLAAEGKFATKTSGISGVAADGPPVGTAGPSQQTIMITTWGTDGSTATVYATAKCSPTAASMAKWRNDVQAPREQEIKRRRDQYDAAKQALDNAASGTTAIYDPLTELMRRILQAEIIADLRDTCHEVVEWHEIFDWEGMSYRLYPPWWDDANKTAYERVTFLNASWAQLYIPVTRGCEEVALKLLLGPLSKFVDAKGLHAEITKFRNTNFPDGTVIEMGRWFDTMPTDGTYVEPILGKCDGCDEILKEDIKINQDRYKNSPPSPVPPEPVPTPEP